MKGHIFYNSIFMKYPETGKFIETETRLVVPETGGREDWGVIANGCVIAFCGDKCSGIR